MNRQTFIRCVVLAGTLLTSACAAAPLYHAARLPKGVAIQGDIPRDGNGEPVWTLIKPRQAPVPPDLQAIPEEALP